MTKVSNEPISVIIKKRNRYLVKFLKREKRNKAAVLKVTETLESKVLNNWGRLYTKLMRPSEYSDDVAPNTFEFRMMDDDYISSRAAEELQRLGFKKHLQSRLV